MSKTLYFLIRYSSFAISFYKELSANTQSEQVQHYVMTTNEKNVGACICLFDVLAYHSQSSKQTEKHPRRGI